MASYGSTLVSEEDTASARHNSSNSHTPVPGYGYSPRAVPPAAGCVSRCSSPASLPRETIVRVVVPPTSVVPTSCNAGTGPNTTEHKSGAVAFEVTSAASVNTTETAMTSTLTSTGVACSLSGSCGADPIPFLWSSHGSRSTAMETPTITSVSKECGEEHADDDDDDVRRANLVLLGTVTPMMFHAVSRNATPSTASVGCNTQQRELEPPYRQQLQREAELPSQLSTHHARDDTLVTLASSLALSTSSAVCSVPPETEMEVEEEMTCRLHLTEDSATPGSEEREDLRTPSSAECSQAKAPAASATSTVVPLSIGTAAWSPTERLTSRPADVTNAVASRRCGVTRSWFQETDDSGSSCVASQGWWTLMPRRGGVNELLRHSNTPSQLLRATSFPTATPPLWTEAVGALEVWGIPVSLELHHNSAGGTYMVQRLTTNSASMGKGAVVAVFKPREEEIGQSGNPHANLRSDRAGSFTPGSGSRREVLAYRLDHGHNAGVPAALEVASAYWVGGEPAAAATDVGTEGRVASHALDGDALSAAPVAEADGDAAHAAVDPRRWGRGTRMAGKPHPRGAMAARRTTVAAAASGDAPKHAQIGSLHLFMPGCQEAADVLPGQFNVDEVHALAIFDIRTLNGDRHGGNVLVQNYRRHYCGGHRSGGGGDTGRSLLILSPGASDTELGDGGSGDTRGDDAVDDTAAPMAPPHLIPIDHSYICPSGYADPDYEWLAWPQAKKPFSERNLAYIAALDAEADAKLVRAALLLHSGGGVGATASAIANSQTATGDVAVRGAAVGGDGFLHANDALLFCEAARSPIFCSATAGEGRAASPSSLSGASGHQDPHNSFLYPPGEDLDLTVFSPTQTASPNIATAVAALGGKEGPAAPFSGFTASRRTFENPACHGASEQLVQTEGGHHDGIFPPHAASVPGFPVLERPLRLSNPWAADKDDAEMADAAADVMRCTTRLLQIAALEFHMTAYEIGSLCRRPRIAQASFFEEVFEEARDELTWELEWEHFDALVRERLNASTAFS